MTRHRRLLAAGLAAAAAAAGLQALAPAPPATATAVVAARDLTGGATLRAEDVTTVELPPSAVPSGAVSAAQVAGRVLAGPIRTGTPLTDVDFVGRSLVRGLGADLVAVPVRLADPAVGRLVRPGDRIDVLATTVSASGAATGSADVVAADVPVLTVPSTGDSAAYAEGSLVVVAARPATAAALAAAEGGARLSLALRP